MNTGTAAYPVKLAVTPGRNGQQPSLTLAYNSGSGNSPYGLGWNLSLPYIQRKTDDGQPKYADGDTFVYSNGEELVKLVDGTWALKNTSAFYRFQRIGNYWEARDKSGRIYRFGQYPAETSTTRSRMGKNALAFNDTYKWLIDESIDTNGNVIRYIYSGFEDSPGQLYISEIRYNFSGNQFNSVVFGYEARSDFFSDYRPGFLVRTGKRVSAIRMLSLGNQVREYRLKYDLEEGDQLHPFTRKPVPIKLSLLKKIVQYDKFGENFLPPLRLEYTGLYTFDVDHPPTGNFPGSEDIDLNNNGLLDQSGVQQMKNTPQNLTFQDGNTEFIDINGDGLVDILNTKNGQHTYYLNTGDGEFAAAKTMLNSPFIELRSEYSTLADLDGDGRTDLLNKAGESKWVFYRNLGNGSWAKGLAYGSPPAFDFNASDTRFTDINLDKKIDLVRSNTNGTWSYCLSRSGMDSDHLPYNNFPGKEDVDKNGNGLLDLGEWDCIGSKEVNLWGGIFFQNPDVKLADMNGDRLQDIVWMRLTQGLLKIGYWSGTGLAEFSGYVSITPDLETGPVNTADLKLTDVNGDGLSDLVFVRPGSVSVWFNLADGNWSEQQVFGNTVFYNPLTTSIRFADLNANGTSDLVWIQAVPATPEERVQFLDFSGQIKPNQLRVVDNGLGRRITIEYKSTTAYMVEADQAENPWTLHAPFPMQVVSRVITETGLDLDTEPGNDQLVIEYNYRDAYYDPYQKEFRGFAFVKKIERGDDSAPTRVTRNFYHTGAPDTLDNDGDGAFDERGFDNETEEQCLKGQILKQEITTAAGGADSAVHDGKDAPGNYVFQRAENNFRIDRIHTIDGGKQGVPTVADQEVSFSANRRVDSYLLERNVATPKQLRKTFTYDAWGNLLEERNYGEISFTGDEAFTTNEYAQNPDAWIMDKVSRTMLTGSDGQKTAETLLYYDGEDYQGLALGQVEKGNLTRKLGWVVASEYVNQERKSFDEYGNVIGIKDGNDNLRTLEYDPVQHTFPVKETIHLEADKTPLQVLAQYDAGFGKVIQSTDYNGHQSYYEYDSFGRSVKIIQPGDSWDYPTQEFTYRMVDPHRGTLYNYQTDGFLELSYSSAQASAVITKAREKSGLPGTLDNYKFVDGMGRELMVMEEGNYDFIVKNAVRFNTRGSVRYVFQPYYTSVAEFRPPDLQETWSEKTYDALGRETIVTHPPDENGVRHQVETRYYPLQTQVIDENGHPKDLFSDGLERTIKVHEHNLGETYETKYRYNAVGNLIRITDAQNNIKTLAYDGLGRKTTMNDPDNGITTYAYDAAGNLIETRDNKEQLVNYGYDGANRILTEDFVETLDSRIEVSYHYDLKNDDFPQAENLKGQLSYIEDQSGAVFFSYDEKGNTLWNVKRITDGDLQDDYPTSWNYDAMNRVTSVIWPDGAAIRYEYDNRGLLSEIPGFVTGIEYDAAGQLLNLTYQNGVATDYSYDPRNRLTELKSRTAGQTDYFQNLAYRFDGKGNISTIIDKRTIETTAPQHAGQDFRYDDLDRLTVAGGVYGQIDFQYDRIGNLIHKTSPGAIFPDHVDDDLINLGAMNYGGIAGSSDHIGKGDAPGPHAVTATENGFIYDYDANGNMILHQSGDQYTWDYKNRLIGVIKGGVKAQYVYDYSGQRVIKTVSGEQPKQKVYYVNKEYEIRNDKIYKYVFVGSRRAARIETERDDAAGELQQIIRLHSGWNFISFQALPSDSRPEVIFGAILPAVESVYTYDSDLGRYLRFIPGQVLDLKEILPNRGYLVNAKYDSTLVVDGTKSITPVSLKPGWNLAAFPLDAEQDKATALSSLQGHYNSVWTYDTIQSRWQQTFSDPDLPAGLDNLDNLQPNRAYWIEMKSAAQLANTATPTGTITYYHPDHLGSTSLTTNETGVVLSETAYYPFGRPRFQQTADGDGHFYKYTGKELDQTGLFYYEARYMDPVIGRFISADPLLSEFGSLSKEFQNRLTHGPQEQNNYSYGLNNPIIFIDPNGEANVVVGGADDCAKKGCSTWMSGPSNVYTYKNSMFNTAGLKATKHDMFFTHNAATYRRKSEHSGREPSRAFNSIKKFHQAHPKEPIDLFGHSWGGPASMKLLSELEAGGIPVRSINTFDPIKMFGTLEKPKSSKAFWKNFFPGWRNRNFSADKVSNLGGELDFLPGADQNYKVTGSGSGHIGVLAPTSSQKVNSP